MAKYAGLKWRKTQSGEFQAEETRLTRTGNRYLRYYLCEAANRVRQCAPEYRLYHDRPSLTLGHSSIYPSSKAKALLSGMLCGRRQNEPRPGIWRRVSVYRHVFSAGGALIRQHHPYAGPGPTVKAVTPIGGISGLNVMSL